MITYDHGRYVWKYEYCKNRNISPYDTYNWNKADIEYENYLSNLDGDNVSKDKDKEPPIDDTNKWVSWYLRNNPSKSLKEARGELFRKRGFRVIIG